ARETRVEQEESREDAARSARGIGGEGPGDGTGAQDDAGAELAAGMWVRVLALNQEAQVVEPPNAAGEVTVQAGPMRLVVPRDGVVPIRKGKKAEKPVPAAARSGALRV